MTERCIEYPLSVYPASWDFLQWLVNVYITYGPINVKFIPGPKGGFRDDTMPRPLEAREAIFRHVMKPALQLLGMREGRGERVDPLPYTLTYAVQAARIGVQMPKWQIPQWAMDHAKAYLGDRKPLVITLREASYYPLRNSDAGAWTKFAAECGEDVIFVRDTAKADQPYYDFETCPRASKELLFPRRADGTGQG
jgi:hypothetical protein